MIRLKNIMRVANIIITMKHKTEDYKVSIVKYYITILIFLY